LAVNSEIKKMDFRLSLDNTQIIKGIAICLMLWHHLFYQHPEYGNLVFQTALFGKVCVSLFLFLSAYGLTVQYGKVYGKTIAETFKFQAKRFVKFYANYWVIFLIFVPIGIFVFGRSLNIPYEGLNKIKALFTDLLGLNGLQSYNITWWFNKLIIILYFLFPILYFIAKKWSILLLIAAIILSKFDLPLLPIGVHAWIFHFALGIVYALHIDKVNQFFNRFNHWILFGLLFFGFCILFYLRNHNIIPYIGFTGITVDAFLSVNIVVLILLIIRHIHTYIHHY
jgi:peptidoglycan/LPS O-acetylase OafA/YrhL